MDGLKYLVSTFQGASYKFYRPFNRMKVRRAKAEPDDPSVVQWPEQSGRAASVSVTARLGIRCVHDSLL